MAFELAAARNSLLTKALWIDVAWYPPATTQLPFQVMQRRLPAWPKALACPFQGHCQAIYWEHHHDDASEPRPLHVSVEASCTVAFPEPQISEIPTSTSVNCDMGESMHIYTYIKIYTYM